MLNTEGRQMASIREAKGVYPIEGADRIERVEIDGWDVVCPKGQISPGDSVVYFEIDSALPLADPRFEFLASRGTKKQKRGEEFVDVHVLRTAKLRGVWSQGLAMPFDDFPEIVTGQFEKSLDELLKIEKWDPETPGEGYSSTFPNFLQKTDAERVQNLDWKTWIQIQRDHLNWEAIEKIDGTSSTFWKDLEGNLHAAGRNWEYDWNPDNRHWQIAEYYSLGEYLQPGEWIQGEIAGPGLQGNPLDLSALQFFAFGFGHSVENETTHSRAAAHWWPTWAEMIKAPTYDDLRLPMSTKDAVWQVDGIMSLINPERAAEGVVWTHRGSTPLQGLGNRNLFKAISNKYLVKEGK